ncbi:anthranilate synthase component I [Tessaracoccus flavus]|uniref:Anthranilate synthase component 1 n=1 Tax=Tessaracoccus flavus TaxID=1610493 RepID=A0A1Q2CEL4_9ACTN|nr:anthranilate synthase component I [Tessaracoccus flavus]AQP44495.1 anthranilate synthase component I [Tessaracoccus flavus]SDY71222.1 anthranilate synthase component 1 [Tessaracoccus flavus]
MRITPSLEEFTELASGRRVISVHARLLADDLTPVALYDLLCGDREGTFLFESAEAGVWSRYSFVGVRSAATLTEVDGRAHWIGQELVGIDDGDPLQVLRQTLTELATPATPGLPPFHAGMVGYLGYDVVRRLERLPDTTTRDLPVPELVMMLSSEVAVLDHHLGELWLIANAINFDGTDEGVDRAYRGAVAAVEAMAEAVRRPRASRATQEGQRRALAVHRQRSSEEFRAAVEAAKEEIRAGEAFQIVVSQRFDVSTSADALDVYRALRVTNPSPYLYLLRLPGFAIVGSSPEALVTVQDGLATTRPIAGSRPRGATPDEDRRLADELLADPKERAEHLMLVDLGRNDLGRVCEPGSVTVDEFMNVHRYSHIMHLEAAVSGRVRPGLSALDATLACFPAGTLSGAPKVRAMEIIDRLEVSRRGVYGGVVGYFDFAGNSDVAIAIRTAVMADGVAHVQAGAGIVADSVPELEDAECSHKARAVLTAIARAEALGRP